MSIRLTGAVVAGIVGALAGDPVAAETVRGQWSIHRQAEGPGASLPPELLSQREATAAECREDGGTPGASPDFIRSVDFNGDGRPDYVVDHGKFDCAGAVKRSCGSAGCSIDVFLSGKAGYRDRMSLSGYEAVIDANGERPTLTLEGRDAVARYRWNGKAFARQPGRP
jgi:hypothetical protein